MSLGDGSGHRRLRALSHPLRLRILSMLTGSAASAAELARELGLSHAAVSFHVRQLAAAGYLELAETRSVRGGQERRYRNRVGGHEQWAGEDPRLTVQAAATELVRRLADGGSRWRVFGDAELWVDPAAWKRVVDQIGAAVVDLHEAAAPPRTPGTLHVNATVMLFEIGDPEPTGDAGPAS
jgi:DNA-binding transcriptional ArsR family regulator